METRWKISLIGILLITCIDVEDMTCQNDLKKDNYKVDCLSNYAITMGCVEGEFGYEESQKCNDELISKYLNQKLKNPEQQKIGNRRTKYELSYQVDRTGTIEKGTIQLEGKVSKMIEDQIVNIIREINYAPNSSTCRKGVKWLEEKEIWIDVERDNRGKIVVRDKNPSTYKFILEAEIYENYEKQNESNYGVYVELKPREREKTVEIKKGKDVIGKIDQIERASGIFTILVITSNGIEEEKKMEKLEKFRKIYDMDCSEPPIKPGIYLYGLNDCIGKLEKE
ncbi:MAG: hypothetical protein R2828_34280 [Saprospiraceae bacterium]